MGERRRVLVTGANRGIGLEIARQLAGLGISVLASARTSEGVREISAKLGAPGVLLDVTRPETFEPAARAVEEGGGLTALVNNAGITLNGFDATVAEKTLDVNFFGAMHLTDRLLPWLRPDGRIVMVSSRMGELSCLSPELRERFLDPNLTRETLAALVRSFVDDVAKGVHAQRGWPSSAYRVSKVAMNALTRILARELANDPRRLLVNAACPGWVRSRMGGAGAPRSTERGAETPVWLATLPPGGQSGGFFQDERAIEW